MRLLTSENEKPGRFRPGAPKYPDKSADNQWHPHPLPQPPPEVVFASDLLSDFDSDFDSLLLSEALPFFDPPEPFL